VAVATDEMIWGLVLVAVARVMENYDGVDRSKKYVRF
jgi:hypothetical protein